MHRIYHFGVDFPSSKQLGPPGPCLGRGDGDSRRSRALVALGGDNLVRAAAKGTNTHAQALPGVKVVAGGDGTGGAEILTDAPVLLKGLAVALDGGGVCAGRLVDVVGGAVAVDGAHMGGGRARVLCRFSSVDKYAHCEKPFGFET